MTLCNYVVPIPWVAYSFGGMGRVQHRGQPYRVLYAFDPRRVAILLIAGTKTGDERWYDTYVPTADDLYDEHLETLKREGLTDG